MEKTAKRKTKVYTIYVGITDGDTLMQEFTNEDLKRMGRKYATNHRLSFSATLTRGGYTNNRGEYITEPGFAMRMIGASEEDVERIADDLLRILNQDEVTITVEEVETYTIIRK